MLIQRTLLLLAVLMQFYIFPAETVAIASNQSEGLTTVGLHLNPLTYKGQSFFPIGAYSEPRTADGVGYVDLKEVSKNGWNTVIWYRYTDKQSASKYLSNAKAAGIKVIVAVNKEVKSQNKQSLLRILLDVKDNDAILGYYIFDEPENTYYNDPEYKSLCKRTGKANNKQFGEFIIEKIGWASKLIRQVDNNPEHYIFMCIGWWTHYEQLQNLCDINLANHYPTVDTKSEFEGEHAILVYDAHLAAKAAFKANGRRFCYTPFAINMGLETKYRYPTIREFRYSVFAPITQGAMGIIYWAGYRCKTPYTEQVVYPVTRELNQLSSFFLGKWLNEKFQCEPSESDNPVLKKLAVSHVSGCLRQRDDGKYLAIVVNNTAEKTRTFLRLSLDNMPNKATEFISGRVVSINDGIIREELEPYGVAAFIIEPETGIISDNSD